MSPVSSAGKIATSASQGWGNSTVGKRGKARLSEVMIDQ